MNHTGPYVTTTIALVGFAVFAGLHHLHLWWSRRERSSLLFAACCAFAAVVCGAHAVAATAGSVEAGQRALDLRTTFGLLTHASIAALIAAITGVQARPYRWGVIAFLIAGVAVNVFVSSLVGTVVSVDRETMPWGEELTLLGRASGTSWFPRAIYAAVASVHVYALIGARALWAGDRATSAMMALAGLSGLAASVIGVLIDTQVVQWPYIGQWAVAVWVLLLALLMSRQHVRDVDERRLAEESLRASETSLAAVIANSPGVAIQWYDETGRVLLWNRASEEMFGYTAGEALGLRLDALIHTPEQCAAFVAALASISRTGQPVGPTELEFRRRFNDARVCVSTIFQIPPGPDGGSRFVRMDVDITEMKRVEEALALSEARFRTLIQSAPEAIVVFDVEKSCFTDLNEQACVLFGWPAERLREMNPVALSPPYQLDGRDSESAVRAYLDAAAAGATPVFEWLHRTADGRDIPCEVRLVRLPHPTRTLVRGSVTDISSRRQLEAQVRQAQKMDAVGQLAGGIAHDFNNLLTVICGFAELLEKQLAASDPRVELVKLIEDAGRRAAWLTERLLAFSRRAVLTPQVVDLKTFVLDIESMLRRLIGEDVELIVRLHDGPGRVRIDPGQWSQVIMNLAINARDAMPDGGRLMITTRIIDVDPATATTQRPPGRYVQLAVSDTGCGMSEEVISRLFEPFFTTKPVGKGTGLGLPVVHGIVTQAGGFIDVASTPGAGAVFMLHVPLVTDDLSGLFAFDDRSAAEAGAATAPLPLRRETILLVEDADAVRQLIETALRPQGFTVLVADDGRDAMRMLDTHAGRIDLLISDLVLPGIQGRQLGKTARMRHPRLKALFISGNVEDEKAPIESLGQGQAFLRKPFSIDTFNQKVRELLD